MPERLILTYILQMEAQEKGCRCAVGGFDRKKHTISLHAYRTNKRLTQGAKVKDCQVLTWVAFRSWLVVKKQPKKKGKGDHPRHSAKKGTLIPPLDQSQGSHGPIR
jgi:hypothetical protein